MAMDQALDDYDRAEWLSDLSNAAVSYLNSGSPVIVVGGSALRVAYRDVFRLATANSNNLTTDTHSMIRLHFIYLKMDESKALGLVDERGRKQGHFMRPVLVRS